MSESLEKTPVHFGSDVLRRAQKAANLTDYEIAKELGIGERTWARWKAKGDVLYQHLTAVVVMLGLPEPADLPADAPRTPWVILRALEDVLSALRDIRQQLERPAPPGSA